MAISMYKVGRFSMIESLSATNEWVLTPSEGSSFNEIKKTSIDLGRPMVLWGWKRDRIEGAERYPESRTVYFSADLKENGGCVEIERAYFYLNSRAKAYEILKLQNDVKNIKNSSRFSLTTSISPDPKYNGYLRFRMEAGEANLYDKLAVERRLKGQPRMLIQPPKLVPESINFDISKFAPLAVCVGSGLSSESGLALLGSIHNIFEVDNPQTGRLVFGSEDNLPKRLASSIDQEFRNFCQFTIDSFRASPSASHLVISDLYQKGIVRQVFTDNMDNILAKVNVPFTSTRQGIFPDRYPVSFDKDARSLLVIGVAVDRRAVIKQARKSGLKIIAINPVLGVAPHSRNMDYLSRGDIFFKMKACEALPRIVEASGF